MENSTQRETQSGPFFSKIRAFFSTYKLPCPPSCMPVSVDEYTSVSLNIPKYPWKCLQNVLTMPGLWICLVTLHIRQAFEDASGSTCVRVLNMARLYMQGLHRVLIKSEYGSICPNNVSVCLNSLKMVLINIVPYETMIFFVDCYVLILSRIHFRVNPHSMVAWMSRNSLLETGMKSEV